MKVLIVEENAAMRRLIRSLVEEAPYAVSECGDGEQALAACVAQQPDWVLLDLTLGQTGGLAAARQIRLACPRVRVVIVSDDDQARLRSAAEQAGACGYLLKENLLEVRQLLRSA
jgi:CheY-like chemotaxis protein